MKKRDRRKLRHLFRTPEINNPHFKIVRILNLVIIG